MVFGETNWGRLRIIKGAKEELSRYFILCHYISIVVSFFSPGTAIGASRFGAREVFWASRSWFLVVIGLEDAFYILPSSNGVSFCWFERQKPMRSEACISACSRDQQSHLALLLVFGDLIFVWVELGVCHISSTTTQMKRSNGPKRVGLLQSWKLAPQFFS